MNSMANPKQYLQMNPLNNTGVVLMIVLFSFGILFSNWITPINTFPGTNTLVEPLPVPQITNEPRIFTHEEFEYASNSRNPLVVLQDQDIPTERLEKTCDAVELRTAIADVSSEQTQNVIIQNTESADEMSTAVTVPARLTLGPVITKPIGTPRLSLKTETPLLPPNEPLHFLQSSEYLRIPQSNEPLRIPRSDEPLRFSIENETELTELHPHISVWKANTTYLLCGKVSQVQPAAGTLFDTEQQDTLITFFIPPDKSSTDKLFLMVTCKVVETAFTPAATVEISNPVLSVM